MRVLLVRPPVPPQTMGLKHVMICEPLELEYVAAGIPGHEVAIFDGILERGLERRLRDFRPDVVGTSCYVTGVHEAVKVCRAAKRWRRDVKTVVGGVHASLAPGDFADAAVDAIVPCDGTSAMPDLLRAFAAGTDLEDVPGLALPRVGGLVRTAPRPYMPHPDTLPFPRRDLVAHLAHRYYYLFHQPVALMKTTWGCWYRCNFCFTWRVTGGTPYVRSPESIVDEMATIGPEDVYIVDDIFLIQRTRLSRIAQLLRQRGIRKKFLAYGRADFIADNEDLIAEWAELGLHAAFIGLEAVTDPELDSMDKRTTVDANRRAIEVLRRHRVDTYGSLITQPDYGPEDWARLRRFIDEHRLYYLNVSPLTPLPGTTLWAERAADLTVPRAAHPLWDLSHVLLPTRQPLKTYYRALLATYAHACLDPRRAATLSLRTAPPLLSRKFLRLWAGALRIALQFRGAHRHHTPRELARAMDRGPAVPGLVLKPPRAESPTAAGAAGAVGVGAAAPAAGDGPVDPFAGFFESAAARRPAPLLDVPAAQAWLRTVGWGRRVGLYTYLQPVENRVGARADVGGRPMLQLSSYDYLGLLGHPALREAAIAAVRDHGTGTGGVPLLTGSIPPHRALAEALAAWKRVEAALLFSSGYAANLAVIPALVGPRDRILADERAHRSLIDACRLSGAHVVRLRHNDPVDLERALVAGSNGGRTLVVVEGAYSMDGDVCPLPAVVALKQRHGAMLLVDEAHSLGTLGATGRGCDELTGVAPGDVDVWTGSLSKALASTGGFVAGSRGLVAYLAHGGGPYMFSAALSPASTAAARAALGVLAAEPGRVARLADNAAFLRDGLRGLGFDTGVSTTAIVPVVLGDNERAWRAARFLFDRGLFATAVAPPAVPPGGARLRLCATAAHDRADLEEALDGFAALAESGIVSAAALEVHA